MTLLIHGPASAIDHVNKPVDVFFRSRQTLPAKNYLEHRGLMKQPPQGNAAENSIRSPKLTGGEVCTPIFEKRCRRLQVVDRPR